MRKKEILYKLLKTYHIAVVPVLKWPWSDRIRISFLGIYLKYQKSPVATCEPGFTQTLKEVL